MEFLPVVLAFVVFAASAWLIMSRYIRMQRQEARRRRMQNRVVAIDVYQD